MVQSRGREFKERAHEGAPRAAHAARSVALERVARALGEAHDESRRRGEPALELLLIKGAALAATVYPNPWAREMDDVDLVVRPEDEARALAVLERAGAKRAPLRAPRPLSDRYFYETRLELPLGAGLAVVLELHTSLDPVVPRAGALARVMARATPLPTLPSLRAPDPVDHLALVAAHLAKDQLRHPPGLEDARLLLELVARAPGFPGEVAARARSLCAATALWLVAEALAAREVPHAAELARALSPTVARRALLAPLYGRAGPRFPRVFRWPWMLLAATARDDLGAYVGGVARYAVARAAERALARVTLER
jgi:hypothetical protein